MTYPLINQGMSGDAVEAAADVVWAALQANTQVSVRGTAVRLTTGGWDFLHQKRGNSDGKSLENLWGKPMGGLSGHDGKAMFLALDPAVSQCFSSSGCQTATFMLHLQTYPDVMMYIELKG